MVLCVSLNTAKDILVPITSFSRGSILRTTAISDYPAGKAINSARALKILGSPVLVTGFCGKESLKYTKDHLSELKINSRFISVPGRNRACVLINESVKNAETVINSESNFAVNRKSESALIRRSAADSKKASCCIVSGSLPVSCSKKFFKELLTSISSNTKLIADSSKAGLVTAADSMPYVLKANIHEFSEAFNTGLNTKNKIKRLAAGLIARGAEHVIITMGAKGSFYMTPGSCATISGPSAHHAVSAVGSGDAYNAGLAHGLDKGLDMTECLRYASAAAFANLNSSGSCFIKISDVKKALGAVKIKRA